MNVDRFREVTDRYRSLRVAVVGDFCLDRYLEIDPARSEISIETGLEVHNVVKVRSQPGGAGTILNNLVALGIGKIHAVGVAGQDGEGWELQRALRAHPAVSMDFFQTSSERQTFTYTKPLLCRPNHPPRELNRLDFKNWTPTSSNLETHLIAALHQLATMVDAIIFLEQVDLENTGVITTGLLAEVAALAHAHPNLLMLGDSRRGLAHFPPITFKMNAAELSRLLKKPGTMHMEEIHARAVSLAKAHGQRVFVTLADKGMLGADAAGTIEHVPALPVRGDIDIVGAGDAVTANLTAALAAGATLREALILANAAASIVIHQLGTTGTASVDQLAHLQNLCP